MKKISLILMILTLIFSSTTTGFAYTKNTDINYIKLNENYTKAMSELQDIISLDKQSIQRNELSNFSNNLVETNGSISYIEHFEQNNTTVVVSEDNYAIASMQDNYLLVIDYNNGKREEFKIDLDSIVSESMDKESSFDIEPSSHDYTTSLSSYIGYFEYYEMRAGVNYRIYELTKPLSTGRTVSTTKSTSSTGQQNFENHARNFLNQLYLAQDMASTVASRNTALVKDILLEIIGAKNVSLVVNTTMGIYETGHTLSEEGTRAALITGIQSAAGIASQYIGRVQTFVNAGLALSYTATYRVQLYNLGQYYNSFANS